MARSVDGKGPADKTGAQLRALFLAREALVYEPPLTRDEAELLDALPYDYPAAPVTKKERRIARELVAKGLLEKDPTSRRHRVTELGEAVVTTWLRAGWLTK